MYRMQYKGPKKDKGNLIYINLTLKKWCARVFHMILIHCHLLILVAESL